MGNTAETVVAVITSETVPYKVVLPDPDDYIQKTLLDTGTPYEQTMLRAMSHYLSPGDVVLDIGANVGNHTLYLSSVARCRVVAFEPDAHLAAAIVRSAALNGTAELVTVMQMGLGAAPGKAHLAGQPIGNIGGQRLEAGGDIEVAPLDALDVTRPVRAMKIDVEGMEAAVIEGARSLIETDRPVIFVEAGDDASFAHLADALAAFGYVYWETFNATPTHLFVHRGELTQDEIANRLLIKTMRDSFRAARDTRAVKSQLDSANLKYREATRATAEARAQRQEALAALDSAREDIARMAVEAEKARDRATQLDQRVDTLRDKLDERHDSIVQLAAAEARLRSEIEHRVASDRHHSDLVQRFAQLARSIDAKPGFGPDQLDALLAEQREHAAVLTRELAAQSVQLDERAASISDLQQRLLAARLALTEATKRLRRARKRRDEARAEADALRLDLAALSDELEQAHEATASAVAEADTLRLDLAALSDELEQAHEATASAVAEAAFAKKARDDAEAPAGRTSAQLNDALNRAASLQALLDQRSADVRAADQDREQLRAALTDALAAASEAHTALVEARHRAKESAAEVDAVRSSITFRAGRELRRAVRSPKAALRLPLSLWRISRTAPVPPRVIEGALTAREITAPPRRATVAADSVAVPPAARARSDRRAPLLRVAAIVDEFTASSLAPDCELHNIVRETWREDLEAARPDLLFVESAWRGAQGTWHNAVQHLGPELQGIVAWCKERSIPTVFWNKEDPVHFSTFITAAGAFDHVFTTDIDCIGRYKAALGHGNVHLMPFAAQPAVHNPIELKGGRKDAICFAGSYYRRYPERTRNLDDFLAELPKFRDVEIFDRNFGSEDPNYSFPDEYQKYIVGTLPPEEISRAYKGYRFAINLNSVKQSQTMFARRVFELLGSGTLTVSNFSRGLRQLFGDLVITTDSGAEAVRRLSLLDLDHADKIRLLGLRAVMLDHTYADRLAFIAEKTLGIAPPPRLPRVVFMGAARDADELGLLVATITKQHTVEKRALLVTDEPLPANAPDWLDVVTPAVASSTLIASMVDEDELSLTLSPADYYSSNYALDLALVTRYSDARAFGKSTRLVADGDNLKLVSPGQEYTYVSALAARSAAVRASEIRSLTLDEVSRGNFMLEGPGLLATDRFAYCENGATAASAPMAVDDLDIDTGVAFSDVLTLASSVEATPSPETTIRPVSGADLHSWFKNRTRPQVAHEFDGQWMVTSTLADGQHDYIYANDPIPIADLWPGELATAFLDATPGLNFQLVFIFKSREGERLGALHVPIMRLTEQAIPEGTTHVVVALRAYGPGATVVAAMLRERVDSEPATILHGARHLVLTNNYPRYDDLYRNAFVHSRIRAYATAGTTGFEVMRMTPNVGASFDEFENVDVFSGTLRSLKAYMSAGAPLSILVHFLDSAMWSALGALEYTGPVVVWIHGAEIQAWWRRPHAFTTDKDLADAKLATEERLAFWRKVFTERPDNVHFVFVSETFAQAVFEDVGIALDKDAYSVIHNPIDTRLFRYKEKSPGDRHRILSIRPYASQIYANDLTVQTILELKDEDWFTELEFRLVGDGPLFEETVAPVRDLGNVIIERRFLTHREVAEMHGDYGVFLVPTRADTQGVSRDEAMSSGLVPITNGVAAIPEFVDQTCGIIAPAEDYAALANAIRQLHEDPALFLRLSRAASERVRRQSDSRVTTASELDLFLQPATRGGGHDD